MSDQPDYLNPSTKTLAWISGTIGFLFTANQGVGVGGFLIDWGLWGLLVMLVRNTILASVVIFIILLVTRDVIRRRRSQTN